MDKEQLKQCEKYEDAFRLAINANFVRMSQGEFNEVAALYKEILGKTLTKGQMTCSTCRLNTMKDLGGEYFKWKEYYENEKPKRGRPKKIDLGE